MKLIGTGSSVATASGKAGAGVLGTVAGTAVATGRITGKVGGKAWDVSAILALAPVRALGGMLENKVFRTGLIVAGVVTAYHAVKNWREGRRQRAEGELADPKHTVATIRDQTDAMNKRLCRGR